MELFLAQPNTCLLVLMLISLIRLKFIYLFFIRLKFMFSILSLRQQEKKSRDREGLIFFMFKGLVLKKILFKMNLDKSLLLLMLVYLMGGGRLADP